MNTVHPFASFTESAQVLNNAQLWQQCLQAKQLLMVLEGTLKINPGYALLQRWSGYEDALALYGWVMCTEMRARGFSCRLRAFFGRRMPRADFELPEWLGDEEFHEEEAEKLGLPPTAH